MPFPKTTPYIVLIAIVLVLAGCKNGTKKENTPIVPPDEVYTKGTFGFDKKILGKCL